MDSFLRQLFLTYLGADIDWPGEEPCRVYWGSHGCNLERGHPGPHVCGCAFEPEDPITNSGTLEHADGVHNVGVPPYYGPGTKFYGEDA